MQKSLVLSREVLKLWDSSAVVSLKVPLLVQLVAIRNSWPTSHKNHKSLVIIAKHMSNVLICAAVSIS